MTTGRERRAHPRMPLDMLVQFRLHDMDEFLRDYFGTHFGGIEVIDRAIHTAPDGARSSPAAFHR